MDFLPQQNRRVSDEPLGGAPDILAGGKHVVVIGGGDTGSDCIGTSFRQGALSVTQLEIMPAPPEHENKGLTWPNWPLKMRTSSSQAEGAKREFAVLTQKFSGDDGKVQKLHCVQVDDKFKPIAGTEFDLDAQLVLLAMGFVHPVHEGLLKTLGVDLDQRGNVRANTSDYQTSLPKVFSAGDMRRGQSLVVWAIREGRLCARAIDKFLMGTTTLPRYNRGRTATGRPRATNHDRHRVRKLSNHGRFTAAATTTTSAATTTAARKRRRAGCSDSTNAVTPIDAEAADARPGPPRPETGIISGRCAGLLYAIKSPFCETRRVGCFAPAVKRYRSDVGQMTD